jgi:hypothetical protein
VRNKERVRVRDIRMARVRVRGIVRVRNSSRM